MRYVVDRFQLNKQSHEWSDGISSLPLNPTSAWVVGDAPAFRGCDRELRGTLAAINHNDPLWNALQSHNSGPVHSKTGTYQWMNRCPCKRICPRTSPSFPRCHNRQKRHKGVLVECCRVDAVDSMYTNNVAGWLHFVNSCLFSCLTYSIYAGLFPLRKTLKAEEEHRRWRRLTNITVCDHKGPHIVGII